jgi:hypothetical protein
MSHIKTLSAIKVCAKLSRGTVGYVYKQKTFSIKEGKLRTKLYTSKELVYYV